MNAVAERVECFGNTYVDIPDGLRVASEVTLEEMPEDMRCFRIMSPKDGDKRVIWSNRVIADIKAAKEMFMDLLKKGMIPFKVGVDGSRSADRMDEFDPSAEEVIFMPMPAVIGG